MIGELSTSQFTELKSVVSRMEGCTMIFAANRIAASASAWLPWLYDTIAIILIIRKSWIYRTAPEAKYDRTAVELTRKLANDGVLYYS